MKLLCIGWDGATFNHLEKIQPEFFNSLLYKGKLLPEDLFYGTYIDSGNAWTTITTGVSFLEHKVLAFDIALVDTESNKFKFFKKIAEKKFLGGFIRRIILHYGIGRICSKEKRFPMSFDVEYKRVWEYLDGRTLIMCIPVTYPAFVTNGILISGIPHPLFEEAEYPTVYPSEIEEEIRNKFKGYHYTRGKSPVESIRRPNLEEYKKNVVLLNKKAIEVFKELYSKDNFEFGFILLSLIDAYLHVTNDWKEIEDIYRLLDKLTENLVEYISPEYVLILSDHGMKKTIRFDSGIKMDHDTTQGIWASNYDFKLKNHLDVTPSILNLYGKNFIPQKRKVVLEKKKDVSSKDYELIKKHLEKLGYL